MNNKVTIIGAGSVGATVAYTLVATGSVAEIVLIDVNVEKAKGEALDILQATPYLSPTKIYCGTYEDAAGSDIVIAYRPYANQRQHFEEHCAADCKIRARRVVFVRGKSRGRSYVRVPKDYGRAQTPRHRYGYDA